MVPKAHHAMIGGHCPLQLEVERGGGGVAYSALEALKILSYGILKRASRFRSQRTFLSKHSLTIFKMKTYKSPNYCQTYSTLNLLRPIAIDLLVMKGKIMFSVIIIKICRDGKFTKMKGQNCFILCMPDSGVRCRGNDPSNKIFLL